MEPSTMQILFAAPGLNHAIAQKALALHEGGMLASFYSTLVYPWGRGVAGRWKGLASRQLEGIPSHLIHRWPWFEFMRLLSSRLDPTGVVTDRLWEIADKRFSESAGRRLAGIQAVFGFEHASLELFQSAGAHGLPRIYSVPSAHSGLIRKLLEPERARRPETSTRYVRETQKIEARRQARRDAEFHLAEVVVAHSAFTKRSYVEAGFPGEKILCVPFGSPPVDEAAWTRCREAGPAKDGGTPVFLFAGNVSLHKGILTLWEAWRRLGIPKARLLVAGGIHLPPEVMAQSPPGIEYLGILPWEELQRRFQNATALVFPSLSDGFGQVVTEFWRVACRSSPLPTPARWT
ncbi:MAG: glycosyltransferase family 4 protein [Holophagaceae bacterium]|nr:glycosyltransferase family 4 protein [Holophagaceae bacterium]